MPEGAREISLAMVRSLLEKFVLFYVVREAPEEAGPFTDYLRSQYVAWRKIAAYPKLTEGATPAEIFGFGFGSPPPKTVPWAKEEEWLLRQLLTAVKKHLQKNIEIKIRFSRRKDEFEEVPLRVRAVAVPADAYTWSLAWAVLREVYRCKGCGQPTTSRGYCRRCQFKKANDRAARKVEGYLRSHKNRGRLTPEEYSFAREVIEKYSAEKQPKTIHKLVVDALKEQWPERDYSFLAGFGSRSLQQ